LPASWGFSLDPLTSQDRRALAVFLHALELYAFCDADGQSSGLTAMRAAVLAMQPSTRHIAKATIPHVLGAAGRSAVLDWHDEERIWLLLFPECPDGEECPDSAVHS
jgi:hypothetical protein